MSTYNHKTNDQARASLVSQLIEENKDLKVRFDNAMTEKKELQMQIKMLLQETAELVKAKMDKVREEAAREEFIKKEQHFMEEYRKSLENQKDEDSDTCDQECDWDEPADWNGDIDPDVMVGRPPGSYIDYDDEDVDKMKSALDEAGYTINAEPEEIPVAAWISLVTDMAHEILQARGFIASELLDEDQEPEVEISEHCLCNDCMEAKAAEPDEEPKEKSPMDAFFADLSSKISDLTGLRVDIANSEKELSDLVNSLSSTIKNKESFKCDCIHCNIIERDNSFWKELIKF